jgi:pimeloyl-ACP methyl ester carboxylesterase
VVLHGRADELVPHEQAERYVASRGPDDAACRLVLIDRTDHFQIIDPGHHSYPLLRDAVAGLAESRPSAGPGQR